MKRQNKVTQCSVCKKFKNAGTACRTDTCAKFMRKIRCPICNRSFFKLGNHTCTKTVSLDQDCIKPSGNIVDSNVSTSFDLCQL